MRAKTAAKGMWILMGIVLLSFLALQNFNHSKNFRTYAAKKRSPHIQCEALIESVKSFTEFEGLYPRSLAELKDFGSLNSTELARWTLQSNSNTLFLAYEGESYEQNLAVRFSFKPRLMIADIGEMIYRVNSRGPKFRISVTREIKLIPQDRHVPRRTLSRLLARLKTGSEFDCRNAVSYTHKKRGQLEAYSSLTIMTQRFPKSHWASVAKAHMMLDRQSTNDREFWGLTRRQASVYIDWFHASRLYLKKSEFYTFAEKRLPSVPASVRDECYEHVVLAAYHAKDYKTALKFCERWDNKASAEYYAASALAAGSPRTARFIYEKHYGPIADDKAPSRLQKAILAGNILFTLPEDLTKPYPFFTDLADFLIFPDEGR